MILQPAKIKTFGLFSGSATYLASNILNAVIPFVLLPVLTRYLSTTEYGQVAMFQTLVAALAALVGVNTQGAANRKYYDANITHQELAHFVGACIQILFMSSILIFFPIFILRQSLASWLGLNTSWILWAVAVSTAGFLINLRLGQWQIRKFAFKYGTLQVSQGLINATLSLVLVVIFYEGAIGRIIAQIWV
ncbi:MAG: lipopolysaccharide biosynthesis protein, partial [Candidatus Saccharimonadales bacterium]